MATAKAKILGGSLKREPDISHADEMTAMLLDEMPDCGKVEAKRERGEDRLVPKQESAAILPRRFPDTFA